MVPGTFEAIFNVEADFFNDFSMFPMNFLQAFFKNLIPKWVKTFEPKIFLIVEIAYAYPVFWRWAKISKVSLAILFCLTLKR